MDWLRLCVCDVKLCFRQSFQSTRDALWLPCLWRPKKNIRVKRVLFSCCQPHLCTKRHCYFKMINCTWSRSPRLLILSWTLRPQFQAQPYSSESYKVLDIPSTIYSPQPPHTLSTFPSSLPFLMPMSCFANHKCFVFISYVSDPILNSY